MSQLHVRPLAVVVADVARNDVVLRNELAAISEFYGPSADERQVSITIDCHPCATLSADRTLLLRALGNLISNSLAYVPPNGTIEIHARNEADGTVVEVRDSGTGIPAKHLPHVFDRLYRVDGSRSNDRAGSGLGLAIVKSIVEMHGGEVRIASKLGEKTCVTIQFPANEDRG